MSIHPLARKHPLNGLRTEFKGIIAATRRTGESECEHVSHPTSPFQSYGEVPARTDAFYIRFLQEVGGIGF